MVDVAEIWADFDEFESSIITTEKPVATKTDLYTCIECNGQRIISYEGFMTCKECGLADSAFMSDEPEWISGVGEDGKVTDNARCGMPVDTELYSAQWGAGGGKINMRGASGAMKRLAMINFHMSMNHRDRALFHAYKDFDSAGKDCLQLPENVVKQAKIIYRKFNTEKLTRGAVRRGIKANCLVYACKIANVPRSTKEVADAFGIPTKDISRTAEIFKTEIHQEKGSEVTMPRDVIPRLLNEFNLMDKRTYTQKCMRIASKLEKCVSLMGKTPTSVAAVIIFTNLDNGTSKSETAKKCGVSVPTMNKIENIINNYLEGKVP